MSLRVLCIDDDSRLFELLASYLGPNGVTLVHAADGRQGLAALEGGVFDAVLLDVMMPGMDGPSTFRELRKNPLTAKIPVVLLTAKVQSSDQRRFADLGVEAVLFKPFDPLTLSSQIAGALGWN